MRWQLCKPGLVTAGLRGRGGAARALRSASKGSPAGSRVFYLGCLGPAFECLEMLFSRCFLAHAGSVYKQLLQAKPVGAAGGCSRQQPCSAPPHPATGSGPRVASFPSCQEGPGLLTKAPNASSSFLLRSSRPAASCCRCIPAMAGISGLPSCPGFRCWGSGDEGTPEPRPAARCPA